jgi:Flp pilus assembly protein CpaB
MEWVENALSTRRGTLIIGGGAALLAAIVLIVYLKNYRSNVDSANASVSVLVARNLIQKGAPGNLVATGQDYAVREIPQKQLQVGVITDPGTLRGLVATHDIYPSEQLTLADFAPLAAGSLQANLTGDQRAIAVPIDAAHGLTGQIVAGDHVDVFVGVNQTGAGGARPVIKLMMDDALVLGTGVPAGTVLLRASGKQTAALAYAADNGKLWLVLRPASGAKPQKSSLMDLSTLLALKPVQ